MPKQKKNDTKYCEGCLTSSSSRTLKPIQDYYHIFSLLTNNELGKTKQDVYPLMCWECLAMLRNVLRFQEKCKTANSYLIKHIGKAKRKTMHLSDLMETYNDKWFEITHEEEVEQIYIYQGVPSDQTIHTEDSSQQIVMKIEPGTGEDKANSEQEIDCEEIKQEVEMIDDDEEVECKQELIDIEEEKIECKKEIKYVENESELNVKNDKTEKRSVNSKYDVIKLPSGVKNYNTMKINDEERMKLLEEQRLAKNYTTKQFKCEGCVRGFTKKRFEEHLKKFHSKSVGDYECNYCGRRTKNRHSLVLHIKTHYTKYMCISCDYQCLSLYDMRTHNSVHRRMLQCLKCGECFRKSREFKEHYQNYHSRVICDHCNKTMSSKMKLTTHIRRLHTDHKCLQCDRTFSSYNSIQKHNKMSHTSSLSELSYCVECDVQFGNIYKYRRHIVNSTRHKVKVGVPCPVCNKVYHKKWAMKNHYKLVHLKKTNYYCDTCSRYFLNGYRYRQHLASVHQKVPPARTKLCAICGKGFSTNRILLNHTRSHTGERPFECEDCDAKFTQKYSLKIHKQTVHKK